MTLYYKYVGAQCMRAQDVMPDLVLV